MNAIDYLRDKKLLGLRGTKFIIEFDGDDDKSFDVVELLEEFASIKEKEKFKTLFQENENTLYETQESIMPFVGTLIRIKTKLYEVDHCIIESNQNFISVELIEIN